MSRVFDKKKTMAQIKLLIKKEMDRFHFSLFQMELMIKNLEEEKKRFSEQIEAERKAQQDQLNNMKAARIMQAQEERKAFIEQMEVLNARVKEMQIYNEENMRRIKKMSEVAAKQDKEKEELLQQISSKGSEDKEALIKEVNERHVREVKALRDEMNAKLDEVMASAPKVEKDQFLTPGLMNKRTKEAGELHDKAEEIHKARQEIEKPGILKTILKFVSGIVPAAGAVASAVCPVAAPLVLPITGLVGAAAGFVADNICSIM